MMSQKEFSGSSAEPVDLEPSSMEPADENDHVLYFTGISGSSLGLCDEHDQPPFSDSDTEDEESNYITRVQRLIYSKLEGSDLTELDLQHEYSYLDGFRYRSDLRFQLMGAIGRSKSLLKVAVRYTIHDELCELCIGLRENTVLQELIIGDPEQGGDKFAETLCDMLKANSTLKFVNMSHSGIGVNGAISLKAMLSHNSTLQRLDVWDNPFGPDGLKYLLDPLMPNDEGVQLNTSLHYLRIGGGYSQIQSRGAQAIAKTLQFNQTLKVLNIFKEDTIERKGICMILESLKRNKSLEELHLDQCGGVAENEVFATIMDLLQVNFWLKKISIDFTPLYYVEGRDAAIKSVIESNSQKHMKLLRELTAMSKPTSARVFLCGDAYSGKSTLMRSMIRGFETNSIKKMVRPLLDLLELQKPFGSCLPKDENEWDQRTRGIDIKILKDDGELRISIWDLAGQEEYHAFHDIMIPDLSDRGSPTCFLVLCNPFIRNSKSPKQNIEQEISYWLMFIASNTRRSIEFQPRVTIVFAHCDMLLQNLHSEKTKDVVTSLREKFEGYISVREKIFYINAHSAVDGATVAKHVEETCKDILEKLPDVFGASVGMRGALSKWNDEHPEQPMIKKHIFDEQIANKIPSLMSLSNVKAFDKDESLKTLRNAAALSLHEAGEMLYFEDEDFVVVNPPWFSQRVMGQVITLRKSPFETFYPIKEGFAKREDLGKFLKHSLGKPVVFCLWSCCKQGVIRREPLQVETEHLVKLMIKLGLCYEENEVQAVFIPATLQDDRDDSAAKGERQLFWKSDLLQYNSRERVMYVGRRLQSRQPELTCLTPGFFPKLQVLLHNYFSKSPLNPSTPCTNEKNLTRIIFDGIEILVELSGHKLGSHFIDVLAMSSKGFQETLQILRDHVVNPIRSLCTSPQGCIGVELVESVIRPKCVEKLLFCKYRKDQAVLVDTLKKEFVTANFDPNHKHSWPQVDDPDNISCPVILSSGAGDSIVDELLSLTEIEEILKKRRDELENIVDRILKDDARREQEAETQTNHTTESKPSDDDHTVKSIPPDFQRYLSAKFKHGEDTTRQVGQQIIDGVKKSMTDYLNQLKTEQKELYKLLCNKLDSVLQLSIEQQQHQTPCISLFMRKGIGLNPRRLVVDHLLPGISTCQLHFMCEARDRVHTVRDQKGVEVILPDDDNKMKTCIRTLIIRSVRLLNILLKAGMHIVAGIENIVPDVIGEQQASSLESGGILLSEGMATIRAQEGDRLKIAEQWLVDYLRGKNIYELFCLRRVCYRAGSSRGSCQVRWVCDEHVKSGLLQKSLELFPV